MLTVEKKIISDCLSGLGISGAVCLWGPVSRAEKDKKSKTTTALPVPWENFCHNGRSNTRQHGKHRKPVLRRLPRIGTRGRAMITTMVIGITRPPKLILMRIWFKPC